MHGMMLIVMMVLCCGILVKPSIKMIVQRTSSQWEVVPGVGPTVVEQRTWYCTGGKQQIKAECTFTFKFLFHISGSIVPTAIAVHFFKSGKAKPGGFLTGAPQTWEVSCFTKTISKPAKGQFLTQEKLELRTIICM